MTKRMKKHTRSAHDRFWLEFEDNEELDARKLSRAYLALALQKAARLEAERKAAAESGGRKRDGRA